MMRKITFTIILFALLCSATYGQKLAMGLSWNRMSVKELLELKAAGIEYLELNINVFIKGVPPHLHKANMIRLKEVVDSCGLQVWSVHLPYSRMYDISDMNEAKRDTNIVFMQEMIELAGMFNPKKLILHPSAEPIPDNERKERLKRSIDAVGQLLPYAQSINAELCIENLPRTCLCNTSAELLKYKKTYPVIGLCFDSNHLLKETHKSFLRKVGCYITTVHLSDYDGIDERHWIPLEGIVPWDIVCKQLSKSGYDGVLLFEASRFKDGSKASPEELLNRYKSLLNLYLQ